MPIETFTSRALTLALHEEPHAVVVAWHGRSTARDPGEFVIPVLWRALELACESRRPIRLDFRALEYFNSSTMAPVVKLIEEARRRDAAVTLEYDASQRWQELSFSALRSLHRIAGAHPALP
jgi:hypothetical protein